MKLFRLSTVPVSLNILLKGQLKYLSGFYKITAVSGGGMDLNEVKEREGVEVKAIEIKREISLFKDLASLWNLYHFFRNERPTIIHSITPKAGLLSMTAGILAGVPIRIHTFTGLIFPAKTGFMYWLLKNMDRLTCLFATHIIPEGEGVKRDLVLHKVTGKPLKVIGNGNVNGIDVDYFNVHAIPNDIKQSHSAELGILPDHFVFIFIGRLVSDKGINELVQAFNLIHQKYPHSRLLLVGNAEPELDPLLPETERLIRSHPGIITTGFQSDVRPYLAISNALVFPSYREGFPNVPMQAGAMGLPSIVTDINGCNEIIQHEFNGLIIPPKNTDALVSAMSRLIAEPNLTDALASNARESIVSRFDRHVLWNLIKEEYDAQLRIHGLSGANVHP